jgi:UDPglucose--hexose-1-phosphate uridylyltransferase
MAKFVPDIKTQRWVVIAPGRIARPSQVREVEKPGQVIKKGEYFWRADCPFCFGNEEMTPPEVYRWGKTHPADPNWLVRVVPNKYPITDTHEVIIHSPDHKLDFAELPLSQVEIILKVYRERYRSLTNGGQVLIFNNKGIESGESLVHPHSQVAVLPRQIRLDVLPLEPVRNIVSENTYFITYCPDFSQWPYETWIAAKRCCQAGHKPGCTFGEVTNEELSDLAKILQEVLQKLLKLFPDLSYNFYIAPGGCWYLRIIPRLTERAGLELGTGLHVNTIDPAKAAEELKK